MLKTILDPMLKRPDPMQCGALVYRKSKKGLRILVITSRGTKRWIIPKGWPMDNKTLLEAAQTEAWEEAGVKNILGNPYELGSFRYKKRLDSGLPIPVFTHVFAFETDELAKKFPEKGQRKRKWVTAKRAKIMLKDGELSDLIDELVGHQAS